ncbi:glycosyl transferase [Spirochaetia bacterium]|nr:glycosyl transferase [Spirochaetia bacterium]
MLIFDILRYGHGIFFVGLQTCLMGGVFLEWRRDRRACRSAEAMDGGAAGGGAEPGALPLVSVLVPIHNEARRMGGLLQSLALQDYAGAEYIFIDDRSADESPAMLAHFAEGRRDVKIITLEENPGSNHKQYALGKGIEAARGEFFLLTDADCELKPGWIRAMVRRMADGRVGAVIAPVFKKEEGKGFFYSYQCYDHIIRYIYLAGAAGLGAAGGGFGNNLILRRACLEAAGGYGAVPPSPTEDAALVSRIRAVTTYQVRAAVGLGTHVKTGAEKSWKSLINQTLRWNNGGLFSPEILTRINYNLLMIVISTGILAIPLLPFVPGLWPMPLGVLIVMLENTAGALCIGKSSLPRPRFLWIPELLFTPVYFTLMTLMGYLGIRTDWKGNKI